LTNSQKIGSSVDSGRADGSRRVIGHLAEREISSGGDRIKNIGIQGDKGSTLVEGYKKVAPGTGVWHELSVTRISTCRKFSPTDNRTKRRGKKLIRVQG